MNLADSEKQTSNQFAFAFLLGSLDREKETNHAQPPFDSFH